MAEEIDDDDYIWMIVHMGKRIAIYLLQAMAYQNDPIMTVKINCIYK